MNEEEYETAIQELAEALEVAKIQQNLR